MSDPTALSDPAERILDVTVDVLRRYGADKTNVVDVAKALGMSHANIYRYFPSKKALLKAVATRWLKSVLEPLDLIAKGRTRPAEERLVAWLETLIATKRRKVLDDPALFEVYHGIAVQSQDLVDEHVNALVSQLAGIVNDGVADGDFRQQPEPHDTARAILQATYAFHYPAMLRAQPRPTDEQVRAVVGLLLSGLLRT